MITKTGFYLYNYISLLPGSSTIC